MFRLFRKRMGSGINVKPAPEEKVYDTLAEGSIVEEKSRRSERADSSSKIRPPSPRDDSVSDDGTDSEELDESLVERTMLWSINEKSRNVQTPAAVSTTTTTITEMGSSSSSDDEVKEILLGCAAAAASASSSTTAVARVAASGATCWLASAPLQGRKLKKALRLSRHGGIVDSPRKKRKSSAVRPFLNFEKMRQSKQTSGFRKVQAGESGTEKKVYSFKVSRSPLVKVASARECSAIDPSSFSFRAIANTSVPSSAMDTSVVVPPHCATFFSIWEALDDV
ncbi:uncharacterized protein [Oscarella lobularis]|uniref:uncharacterized protein isoform X2 n=1 Tax=Oscarella lobularis TaxID=121494 RepID=UPI003313C09A